MPPVLWHRDHAVRLDVDVLLMSRAIRALDDEIRRAKRGVDVALLDVDAL